MVKLSLKCMVPLLLSINGFASSIPQMLTALQPLNVSVAGGFTWEQTRKTHLIISPYETDSVLPQKAANHSVWKIGIGHIFPLPQSKSKPVLNSLLLELNLYHSSSDISGNVWQYQLPQFYNYDFKAPTRSTRLLLDAKPFLLSLSHLKIYPILGLGMAFNTLSYQETIVGIDVDPRSYHNLGGKNSTKFAYDLGAGLQIPFKNNLALLVEYLYADYNGTSSQPYPNTIAALYAAPKFKLASQNLLLGINWTIG